MFRLSLISSQLQEFQVKRRGTSPAISSTAAFRSTPATPDVSAVHNENDAPTTPLSISQFIGDAPSITRERVSSASFTPAESLLGVFNELHLDSSVTASSSSAGTSPCSCFVCTRVRLILGVGALCLLMHRVSRMLCYSCRRCACVSSRVYANAGYTSRRGCSRPQRRGCRKQGTCIAAALDASIARLIFVPLSFGRVSLV